MIYSDETLMAYADGELESSERAAIERAAREDPQIARRIAGHRALRERIHSSYVSVLSEPLPARLTAAAQAPAQMAPVAPPSADNVVPLRLRAARTPPAAAWRWAAIAASALLAILLVQRQLSPSSPIVARGGQLLARGVLASALSGQLNLDQTPGAAVEIGISYRAKSGEYCRTFWLRSTENLAGVACRGPQQWRVEVLAQNASPAPGVEAYRRAGSELPPAVLQRVQAQIDGEPLDAPAEKSARERHWMAPRP